MNFFSWFKRKKKELKVAATKNNYETYQEEYYVHPLKQDFTLKLKSGRIVDFTLEGELNFLPSIRVSLIDGEPLAPFFYIPEQKHIKLFHSALIDREATPGNPTSPVSRHDKSVSYTEANVTFHYPASSIEEIIEGLVYQRKEPRKLTATKIRKIAE